MDIEDVGVVFGCLIGIFIVAWWFACALFVYALITDFLDLGIAITDKI